MIFVVEGQLAYEQSTKPSASPRYSGEGDWFCEACLWADWAHRGTMHAVDMTKLLAIDAAKFMSVAKKDCVDKDVSLYARRFVNDLNKAPFGALNDLSTSTAELEQVCSEVY